MQGDGRRIERGLNYPTEREAGVGEEKQTVYAAARERFPGEGERGLFARVGDPPFQQAGTESGPVSAGVGGWGFEQQLAVAVVAEQIGAHGDGGGQHDGEQGGAGGRSRSNGDGFPEFHEPRGRPPDGAGGLPSHQR